MKTTALATLLFACLAVAPPAGATEPAATPTQPGSAPAAAPRVALETTKGRMVIELAPAEAPKSVASFLEYVRSGFYDGTIFHRVIPGFMVQGGGFTPDLQKKPTNAPVPNEADNGLSNLRGTVALARTGDPHSANAQFFVNLVDNRRLDHTSKTMAGWGYTVFGRVVEGMDVADAIAAVPTTTRPPFSDVPVEPIRITRATVLEPPAKE